MIINFEVKKTGKLIRGVVHRPESVNGHLPCVIFCHGFTGERVGANFMHVKVARALEDMGIISVRFDFLGSGESDGEFKDMTMSREVEECEAIVDYVSKLAPVDSNNINLLGYSLGGPVCLQTAERHPDIIKNLILLSPAADMLDVITQAIRGPKVYNYLKEGWVDFHGNQVSKAAIDDIFAVNLYDSARTFKGGVLLVHGTQDECIPPFTSIKLQEVFPNGAQLKLIDGADHHYATMAYLDELIAAIREFAGRKILS
ncbi:MAG TPA: alpha/beta fold hydrolase [Syntrophomonadaceae bacterium]|nr:alpha/beta fold hydrolase [Syntrophomonadaceae bacterium]